MMEKIDTSAGGNSTTTSSRVAKLVPVPGTLNSFYLSYNGEVTEGDPIYTIPKQQQKKDHDEVNLQADQEAASDTFQSINPIEVAIKSETPDHHEFSGVVAVEVDENDTVFTEPQEITLEASEIQNMEEAEFFEDSEDEGGEMLDLEVGDEEEDNSEGVWSENLTAKIDDIVAQNTHETRKAYIKATGGYKFSGSWKKAPKAEALMKTRQLVLQEILNDYQSSCKVCFENQHEGNETCPLLNPVERIDNKEDSPIRFGMPDEIVFGVSRVYPRQDTLFARDEIPAYTQFGPIEGKLVSMQDLAAMGVVKNETDVANLWPLPIEHGQHEFDFQLFLDTQSLEYSNWLKFINVESPKEEHPPYNIQTVYEGSNIYFVTTKEIEPGGELFLRPFEPPHRVYYNMHRLGEIFNNYCSRGKCKPSATEHLQCHHLLGFVRHQFLVHQPEHSSFSWAAIYNCTICHQDCFDKQNYEKHMKEEHAVMNVKQAPNTCRFCGIVLKTKNYMYKHIAVHHGDANNVPCPYCGKLFKHHTYLQHHIKGAHTEVPEPCLLCNKLCRNRMRMRAHLSKVHKTTVSKALQMQRELNNL